MPRGYERCSACSRCASPAPSACTRPALLTPPRATWPVSPQLDHAPRQASAPFGFGAPGRQFLFAPCVSTIAPLLLHVARRLRIESSAWSPSLMPPPRGTRGPRPRASHRADLCAAPRRSARDGRAYRDMCSELDNRCSIAVGVESTILSRVRLEIICILPAGLAQCARSARGRPVRPVYL